jgi:hypothetical protein
MGRGLGLLLAVALGTAACAPASPPQRDPVGKYQFAGKREYSNGTEVYYLDTTTGDVCYALITNDGKPDSKMCVEP